MNLEQFDKARHILASIESIESDLQTVKSYLDKLGEEYVMYIGRSGAANFVALDNQVTKMALLLQKDIVEKKLAEQKAAMEAL